MKKRFILSLYITVFSLIILTLFYPKEKSNMDTELLVNSGVTYNEFENRYNIYLKKNFFNGESKNDIATKLDKNFKSTLSGSGKFITEYSLEVGVDPYLVASVMLEETGCAWTCSYLARVCNNYGGQKGKPSCNGGSYRSFNSKEEGLKYTINKLAGYYNNGLTTPEQINPKYATSKLWASKINKYMNKLKNS